MIIFKEQATQREVAPGVYQIHYLDKASGAGGVSMGIVTLQPGCGLKTHTHKVEDAMIVLEGKGLFLLGENEHPVEAGMAVIAPAGMPHGLKNNGSAPLKIVYTWPSVEVERFFT
jgi:quercetin dioxygenase-like cupin family protein